MSDAPQTYATHRRFFPLFHFVAFPLAVVYFLWTLRTLWKDPALSTTMGVVGGFALVLSVFLGRLQALKAQDRLIRLEETLRMKAVLPPDLQARIPEVRPRQFVGLRFASDAELPALLKAALDEQLGEEEIKKRIQSWRPDTFRV